MYKKLQILFLFIIVFCALCLSAAAADIYYGDADGDGAITASDAAMVLQYTLNGKWTGAIPVEYCDVDADGYISASDATDILQRALVETYPFKSGTMVSQFKIISNEDDFYYTDGRNVSDINYAATYDGEDIAIKGEKGRYKVLIFGDAENRRMLGLIKEFNSKGINDDTDIAAMFTDPSNGDEAVDEAASELGTINIGLCPYKKKYAQLEQQYRELVNKDDNTSPFTVVIDENDRIVFAAYGSNGVYNAVKVLITGTAYVETTTETTTQTTTKATTETTTLALLDRLISDGKKLRDTSSSGENAYVWLAEVEDYNEKHSANQIYTYLNTALFHAMKGSSPQQYYNKIIGFLESLEYDDSSDDLAELITLGKSVRSSSSVDDTAYMWLARVNDVNEQNDHLSVYSDLNTALFHAVNGSSPVDYYDKIIGYITYMNVTINTPPATTTEATTETTTAKPTTTVSESSSETTTASPNKSLNVGGVQYYIGQSEEDLPDPIRIDRGIEGCYWYIYNKDYHHYTQVGVVGGEVKCIYTMAEDLKYRDISYNADASKLALTYNGMYFYYKYGTFDGVDSLVYFDENDGNKIYGIMLVSSDYTLKEIYDDTTIRNTKYEIMDMTNAFRARHGLAAVKYDTNIETAAQKHAEYMSNNHVFSHVGEGGSKIGKRLDDVNVYFNYSCENIAIGDVWATGAVNGWINSSGHRANMLKNLETMGIGITYKQGNYFIDESDYRYSCDVAYVENFVHVG